MEVKNFSTIYVPNQELGIDFGLLSSYCESISHTYKHDVLIDIRTSEHPPLLTREIAQYPSLPMYVEKIKEGTYINRRDYYKIENFTEQIKISSDGVIAFTDVDTIIAKRIELPDTDWDIAFTRRHPYMNELHRVNLGIWFANIREDNKNRLSWFMQHWLHIPLSGVGFPAAEHYQQRYMLYFPEHRVGKFEFDRIVSQSVINSLAQGWGWNDDNVIYDYNGVKILILDEHYNYPWNNGDPIRDDVYIYHLKGVREAKTIRAKYLMEKIYNV